jgi:hypothetical protein
MLFIYDSRQKPGFNRPGFFYVILQAAVRPVAAP